MSASLTLNLAVLVALVPAAVLGIRPTAGANLGAAVAVAVLASWAWVVAHLHNAWPTGFATALWFTVVGTQLAFLVTAAVDRRAWRLGPMLFPYLVLLGAVATGWSQVPPAGAPPLGHGAWFLVHALVSVATYALATLAAIAGAAVLVQERAVRRRGQSPYTRLLPAIADAESLQFRLLLAAEVVLGLGLVTGLALATLPGEPSLRLDHKILLAILAFVALGGLLIAHCRIGLRGRRAAQWVLAAYLLLTLAYPGVKFVRDVLIG
ncbi:MAG: hypothetical protein EXQ94_01530 [Alphaproteobacteria bacterium]|nr:hypothetical protein [Alphaproteobacteria bacterium]